MHMKLNYPEYIKRAEAVLEMSFAESCAYDRCLEAYHELSVDDAGIFIPVQ